MAAQKRTVRAQEANVGIRRKYERKLINFGRQFRKSVIDDILLHLASENALAQDVSLSNPKDPAERKKLRDMAKKVLASYRRDPVAFRADIEAYVEAHLGEWTIRADNAAKKLAIWVARSIAADVTASQRAAYIGAGLSSDFLKKFWTVPVVRQRISPTAARLLPELVQWSTELITKTAVRDINRIQEVLIEGLTNGQSVANVERTLRTIDGFDADRSRNVAIDQTNKITQGILRANDAELGITKGVWIHVPGQYSSRETHKAFNGKTFDLEKGMYDPAVKKFVLPGELPFCFPGDSKINFTPPVRRLYRRWFVGKLAEVITEDGSVIRATLNHPIFTARGTIPAGKLNVGDYLLKVSEHDFNGLTLNQNHEPSTIGELFDAFKLICGTTGKLNGSYRQFHGDGSNGEVDVIDVCRFLADGFKTGLAESLIEDVFSWSKKGGNTFFSDGLLDKDFLRFLGPSPSGMSMGNERLPLLSGHLSQANYVCLGLIAALYSVGIKEPCDYVSGNIESVSDRKLRLACNVVVNALNRQFAQSGVGVSTVFLSPSLKGGLLDPIFGQSFCNRTARTDFLKRVREVRFVDFSGHVYNLETWSGWYICNYTAVGNCRCVYRPVLDFENLGIVKK
nr:MAG TPA: Minor capsid component [Caudoviricetes sp.]